MNPEIDAFLGRAARWREEMATLRSIALDCGLDEELKWGKPCYLFDGANVAIVQPFKEQCGFMFFKGALLHDPDGVLEPPGPNSRAARRMMFSSVDEVARAAPHLRAFIAQAVDAEKSGVEMPARAEPEPLPKELKEAFGTTPGLKEAFRALTDGRRRAYILHISGAQRPETRTRRVEKCVPGILEGRELRANRAPPNPEAGPTPGGRGSPGSSSSPPPAG